MTNQNLSPRSLELLAEHTNWLRELLIAMAVEIAHRRQATNIVAPDVEAAFEMLEKRLQPEKDQKNT